MQVILSAFLLMTVCAAVAQDFDKADKFSNFKMVAQAETDFKAMHDWWCGPMGHGDEKICVTWYKHLASSSNPEKRTEPTEEEIPDEDAVDDMHDAYCAIGDNKKLRVPCRIHAHKLAYGSTTKEDRKKFGGLPPHLADPFYQKTMDDSERAYKEKRTEKARKNSEAAEEL